MAQADRRAATRAALLDASIDVLIDVGLAGYTINDVIMRSGMSNGALYRYFPTRVALVAATVEELITRADATYQARILAIEDGDLTVERALWTMWDILSSREMAAVYDTYAAARTDPVLSEAMQAVLHPVSEAHRELARLTFAQLGYPEDESDDAATLALHALQGLATAGSIFPENGGPEQLIPMLVRVAEAMYGEPRVAT